MKKLIVLLKIQKKKMDEQEKKQNRDLFILFLFFLIPLLILAFSLIIKNPKNINEEATNKNQKEYVFDTKNIKAESILVTELNTDKIIFKKNEKEKRAIASITKLMTILVASEKLSTKNIDNIKINEKHLTAFGDSGLLVGQVWKVKDLIDFTLITSSNDGAKALALSAFENDETLFVKNMNLFAQNLGLQNTHFVNETGLDLIDKNEAGALSTAEDITKILKFIVLNETDVFSESTKGNKRLTVGDKNYEISNTSSAVDMLPGAIISKTGYTDLAGGNLAIVIDFGLNNPISIVILGSTMEDRDQDIINLYNQTANYYAKNIRK